MIYKLHFNDMVKKRSLHGGNAMYRRATVFTALLFLHGSSSCCVQNELPGDKLVRGCCSEKGREEKKLSEVTLKTEVAGSGCVSRWNLHPAAHAALHGDVCGAGCRNNPYWQIAPIAQQTKLLSREPLEYRHYFLFFPCPLQSQEPFQSEARGSWKRR